jgi:hypothetical protein
LLTAHCSDSLCTDLWKNPKLRELVTRPDFAEDSRAWKIYASTPTISVPNWASLVTGVPPEINGYERNAAPATGPANDTELN